MSKLMGKNLHAEWGEIVFGTSNSAKSQAIRRAIQANKLRKLAPRLYTTNLLNTPESIVKRNLYLILGELFPGAILSHRTALEGGPTQDGLIILSYKYTKKMSLPGLTIRLVEGPSAQTGDTPFMGKLFIASRARTVLENLESTRGATAKSLSRIDIETHLDKICRIHGTDALNQLRDEARQLAPKLNLKKEFQLLDGIVGALLNTKSAGELQSESAKARAQGKAYDAPRVELLAEMVAQLAHGVFPIVP